MRYKKRNWRLQGQCSFILLLTRLGLLPLTDVGTRRMTRRMGSSKILVDRGMSSLDRMFEWYATSVLIRL